MNTEIFLWILGAFGSVIVVMVGATWVLSGKFTAISEAIAELSQSIAVHAAGDGLVNEKLSGLRKDVDKHEERLDAHEREIERIRTGENLKAYVEAAHKLAGKPFHGRAGDLT